MILAIAMAVLAQPPGPSPPPSAGYVIIHREVTVTRAGDSYRISGNYTATAAGTVSVLVSNDRPHGPDAATGSFSFSPTLPDPVTGFPQWKPFTYEVDSMATGLVFVDAAWYRVGDGEELATARGHWPGG